MTRKILVIGSAVADVVITLPHLPSRSEDVHVRSQAMNLGGCGYNVYDTIRHFGAPAIPFLPVGTGAYGDFIRARFKERGIVTPLPQPAEDNGCCYCFVEDDGERTFLSYHGAEYKFRPEWFGLIDPTDIGLVYICGLEIEEDTGGHIIAFLEKNPQLKVMFAPGPRILKILPERMERIFALRPMIHLNETEVCEYYYACRGGKDRTESVSESAAKAPADGSLTSEEAKAAAYLQERCGSSVIVTLGSRGAAICGPEGITHVPGVPARQVDTIGAGDAHVGALLACLQAGLSLPEAAARANRVAAKVVETRGALLGSEEFVSLGVSLSAAAQGETES